MVRRNVRMGAVLLVFLLHASPASQLPQPQHSDSVNLPEPRLEGTHTFEEALFSRRSVRRFTRDPLALWQVSQLLWSAAGKTVDGITGPTRSYPSAGAMHPLELFIVAGRVEGLDPGIYQYQWDTHALLQIRSEDQRSSLSDACLGQLPPLHAPATVVIGAVYDRTVNRYGSRGEERYVPMDAGASAQNIQLQAVALGLGSVIIGAFRDQAVQNLLNTSTVMPLLILPVGEEAGAR